jgi:hypothetical protein
MENRLLVLDLVLGELGVVPRIDTLADRKRVQKAVYLAQLADCDLGYRFGWYLKGPYSRDLTRDYYALADAKAGGFVTAEKRLRPDIRERLAQIRPLMTHPADILLPQEDWLELLSSVHYLRCVSRLSPDAALERLRAEKPHLLGFAAQAEEELKSANLLA